MRYLQYWLFGYALVELQGVEPYLCLNHFSQSQIPFWDVKTLDEFTLSVKIPKEDYSQACTLAEKHLCHLRALHFDGFKQRYGGIFKRTALLCVLALCVLCAALLPQFVWFFQVEGNTTVPADKILRQVRSAGVHVGTYSKDIVPQAIKDQVLAQIPELSWLTVTQKGACAIITVRERETPVTADDRRIPKNIVASNDGIVEDISVLDGTAMVQTGQTVKKGDLLIGGYVDLEYKIRVTGAKGEVYARTWRPVQMLMPAEFCEKVYMQAKKTRYCLQIGNSLINLSSGSGIFTMNCDKMTERKSLSLPGGHVLPVTLIKETYSYYEEAPISVALELAEQQLVASAAAREQNDMVAGQILKKNLSCQERSGVYCLTGTLECREMIGRITDAKIFKDD